MGVRMVRIDPRLLQPHPLNWEIYGPPELDDDFIESVREHGVLEPLVIKEDYTILSGHRRWHAACIVGVAEVECRIKAGATERDEEEILILCNRHRDKTLTQKMRESEHLETIERARSAERMRAGKPQPDGQMSTGTTRDKVGTALGMSGKTYSRAKRIYEAARSGDGAAQRFLEQIDRGETTINYAHRQVVGAQSEMEKIEVSKKVHSHLWLFREILPGPQTHSTVIETALRDSAQLRGIRARRDPD